MNPREEIINEIVEKGVFEAIGDGVSIQDTNFKILYQNNIHKKIIGNHVGEYCYKAYEKNEKVCTGCPLAETFKDGEIHTRARSAPTEKGTIYVEITSSPIKVPSGEIIAGIEVVRDITERKNLEEKFRNLTESVSELIYRAEPDTLLATYVNKSIEQIYGYTVEEWLHNPELWEKTIHPDDKERVFAKIKEAQNTYEPIIMEYRIIRKDRSVRWGKDHISWEKDNDGNVISLNGIMYDITEIKRIEEDLKNSEERYRTLFESNPYGIQEIDISGTILSANKAHHDMYGYKEGRLTGQSITDFLVPGPQRDELPGYLAMLVKNQPPPTKYYQTIVTKQGLQKDVEVAWNYLWDTKGDIKGFISVLTDITEQKKAHEELKAKVEELETFYHVSINRELKMKQLKDENEKLKSELTKYKK